MRRTFAMSLAVVMGLLPGRIAVGAAKGYVGTEACKSCHAAEYDRFTKYATKARSFAAVQKMAPQLTAEELRGCYACHTTAYGQPGGFVSLEATPALSNAGCEVCHGPGSVHVATGDPTAILAKPATEVCDTCHTAARVRSFTYRPLRYGGAH